MATKGTMGENISWVAQLRSALEGIIKDITSGSYSSIHIPDSEVAIPPLSAASIAQFKQLENNGIAMSVIEPRAEMLYRQQLQRRLGTMGQKYEHKIAVREWKRIGPKERQKWFDLVLDAYEKGKERIMGEDLAIIEEGSATIEGQCGDDWVILATPEE